MARIGIETGDIFHYFVSSGLFKKKKKKKKEKRK